MAWLEFTIDTPPGCVDAVAAALTAGGFSELVLEDQQEFEDFLDQNRAYWDYIDESLQEKLQDMSSIKLYLEDTDEAGIAKLEETLKGEDTAAIKAATEELTQLFYKMSEKLYQQNPGAAGADPNAAGAADGNYYDADYQVVDEDENK